MLGVTSAWGLFVNEGADAVASHAAARVAPSRAQARACLELRKQALAVQRRIAITVHAAATARETGAPPSLPRATQRRKLRAQLVSLGHCLEARGQEGLQCTRCRSWVAPAIRRHWIADGRCKSLQDCKPPCGQVVRFGRHTLHPSHDLRWGGDVQHRSALQSVGWPCDCCGAQAHIRAQKLLLPCRRATALVQAPAPSREEVPSPAGVAAAGMTSTCYAAFRQRIRTKEQQATGRAPEVPSAAQRHALEP